MEALSNSDPTVGIDPVAVPPAINFRALPGRVMIALPWGKMTNPMTAFCAAQLMDRRRTTTALNFGDAFVAHSRNSIADVFLKSTSEYMLMLDDDMIVPFGHAGWFNAHTGWNLPEQFAGMNTIDRLLSHGKTLVGALYFGRYGKGNPVYNEGPREREHILATTPRDEIKPTRWIGTGALMIHRSVFEDIEKAFPRLSRGPDGKGGQYFTSSEHNAMGAIDNTLKMLASGAMTGEKALQAFQMLSSAAADARANSMLGLGEDVQFCTRAKAAGHQPYVDLGLLAGHLGTICYPIRS